MLFENEFDLQLFNDGATDPSVDDIVDDEDSSLKNEDEDTSSTDGKSSVSIDDEDGVHFFDEDGDEILLDDQIDFDDESSKDSKKQEKAKPDSTEQPKKIVLNVNGQPREFTIEELEKGVMLNKDYTEKTQKIAERNRQLDEEYKKLGVERQPDQSQPGSQQKSIQPPQQMSDVELATAIANAAESLVVKQWPDYDPDLATPEQKVAFQMYATNIYEGFRNEIIATRAQDDFVSKLKAEEPQFDNIIGFMKEDMDNWSVKDDKAFRRALEVNDFDTLKTIYNKNREAYYNKIGKSLDTPSGMPGEIPMVKQSKQPPIVEKGGVDNEPVKPRKRDATELTGLSEAGKVKWIMENVKMI